MPGFTKVAKRTTKRFLFTNQFELKWQSFNLTTQRPNIGGTKVDAIVGMKGLHIKFDTGGDHLLYQDKSGVWRFAHVEVHCLMDKGSSPAWVTKLKKNSREQNIELLKHERVHVELYERHARYVFKRLLTVYSKKKDIDSAGVNLINFAIALRNKHWQKARDMNQQYDIATSHGTLASEQKKWNRAYLNVKGTNGML